MKNRENKKKAYLWIVILAAVLTLIPLLLLSRYDHPNGDDYAYAYRTFHVWRETGSVWAVIREAAATSAEFYNKWQGLYASAFILALEPGIFGEKYYALTGILMLVIIYGSNLVFSMYILHHKLKASRLEGAAFGCMASFLMVQWMPSSLQGLYWYNGAMNYGFFYGVLLLMICAAIRLAEEQGRFRNVKNVIAASLLALILAGGNHVTAFMGILFLTGMLVWGAVRKEKRLMVRSLVVFFFMMAGFVFNITSPGTKIRQANFEDSQGIIWTIWNAVRSGLHAIDQWLGLEMLVGMLLMLPFVFLIVRRIRVESGFRFRYPFLVFVLSVGWVCAMLCPPLYAMGGIGDGRLLNLVYFFFVLLLFLNEFYVCGWIVEKFAEQASDGEKSEAGELSNIWIAVNLVLAAGLCIGCGDSAASYQASVLLNTGEAAQYSREANERYDILYAAKGQDVKVKAYTVQPWMLYLDDITEDAGDWRNQYVEKYFELESVVVE